MANLRQNQWKTFFATFGNFFITLLKKSFETKIKLQVVLDGTAGYAPSFLDEAFGNLVYDFGLKAKVFAFF